VEARLVPGPIGRLGVPLHRLRAIPLKGVQALVGARFLHRAAHHLEPLLVDSLWLRLCELKAPNPLKLRYMISCLIKPILGS
jgi:hypothetical protein